MAKSLNGKALQRKPDFDKFHQYIEFSLRDIPIPKTTYGLQSTPPFVLKEVASNNGLGTTLVHSLHEAQSFLAERVSATLVSQDVLPVGSDYRVIVLNGEAIAMHKKTAPTNQFLTNAFQGGILSKVEPHYVSVFKKLAISAVEVLETEY